DSKLFITEKSKYFIAITNKFGVLFLPNLNGNIDYQQCLLFNDPKAISWLEEWLNQIKIDAKSIKFSKESYKDKEKILEFIEFLKAKN
ncbi:MAG: hypothetical protein ACFE8P_01465, partial [Promethearchaeota archaeon]